MGVIYTDANADFANTYNFHQPPVSDGLVVDMIGWGLEAKAALNFATLTAMTTENAPVFGASQKYVDFQKPASDVGAIDTGVDETTELTVYLLAKSTDTNATIFTRPQWVTSRESSDETTGFNLAVGSGTVYCGVYDSVSEGSVSATVAVADPEEWQVYVATVSATEARIDATTKGTNGTADLSSVTRVLSDAGLRIGGNSEASSGTCQVSVCWIYNEAHDATTRAQLAAVVEAIGVEAGLLS